jgi:hypothetical protein
MMTARESTKVVVGAPATVPIPLRQQLPRHRSCCQTTLWTLSALATTAAVVLCTPFVRHGTVMRMVEGFLLHPISSAGLASSSFPVSNNMRRTTTAMMIVAPDPPSWSSHRLSGHQHHHHHHHGGTSGWIGSCGGVVHLRDGPPPPPPLLLGRRRLRWPCTWW